MINDSNFNVPGGPGVPSSSGGPGNSGNSGFSGQSGQPGQSGTSGQPGQSHHPGSSGFSGRRQPVVRYYSDGVTSALRKPVVYKELRFYQRSDVPGNVVNRVPSYKHSPYHVAIPTRPL